MYTRDIYVEDLHLMFGHLIHQDFLRNGKIKGYRGRGRPRHSYVHLIKESVDVEAQD